MHEMSIAQSLIDILKGLMTQHGAQRLRSARLHIGRLTMIVPESLLFCFEIMTRDTELQDVKLEMEIVPLKGACQDCGKDFVMEDTVFSCPQCRSTRIHLTAGRDLAVVEIEVD